MSEWQGPLIPKRMTLIAYVKELFGPWMGDKQIVLEHMQQGVEVLIGLLPGVFGQYQASLSPADHYTPTARRQKAHLRPSLRVDYDSDFAGEVRKMRRRKSIG